ncbi:PP0621 family protein [Sulfurimonas sp.]|nr:PP0621 family protein [Sulfurimonas sp.]
MILKLLLVVGVILTVYFLFIKKKPSVTKPKKATKKSKKDDSNEMVECSTCSIYCELDEAILSSNKYYCSDECLEQA